MADALTPAEARRLRRQQGWSLQFLANRCGVNKAYLSEFENGHRVLPAEALAHIYQTLTEAPAGRAKPEIHNENGRSQLVFVNDRGHVMVRPSHATIEWTEADGTVFRMFVGTPDD